MQSIAISAQSTLLAELLWLQPVAPLKQASLSAINARSIVPTSNLSCRQDRLKTTLSAHQVHPLPSHPLKPPPPATLFYLRGPMQVPLRSGSSSKSPRRVSLAATLPCHLGLIHPPCIATHNVRLSLLSIKTLLLTTGPIPPTPKETAPRSGSESATIIRCSLSTSIALLPQTLVLKKSGALSVDQALPTATFTPPRSPHSQIHFQHNPFHLLEHAPFTTQ